MRSRFPRVVSSVGETSPEDGYRVRFTRLGANCYGLSVKRNTGRCSKNPFPRNTRAHSDAVRAVMQHLVANY